MSISQPICQSICLPVYKQLSIKMAFCVVDPTSEVTVKVTVDSATTSMFIKTSQCLSVCLSVHV